MIILTYKNFNKNIIKYILFCGIKIYLSNIKHSTRIITLLRRAGKYYFLVRTSTTPTFLKIRNTHTLSVLLRSIDL